MPVSVLAIDARKRIKPVLDGFQSSVNELQHLTDEVRIRSEQLINLSRPAGAPVPDDRLSKQFISPVSAARPPIIIRPLKDITTDEGVTAVLETEFESGLPPGELWGMSSQITLLLSL